MNTVNGIATIHVGFCYVQSQCYVTMNTGNGIATRGTRHRIPQAYTRYVTMNTGNGIATIQPKPDPLHGSVT